VAASPLKSDLELTGRPGRGAVGCGRVTFAFGVTRTWEYVDGLPLGRWGAVSEATRSLVHKADASPDAQAEAPEDHDGRPGEQ
jgi:hypothetical protein